MTIYSVFERPNEIAPTVVPEKFSWFAALLPPVYALYHGLWLGLLAYVVATVAIGAASRLWLGGEAGFWLYMLLAILIGFEAAGFRRAKLRAKGWSYRSDVVAGAADLAQRDWLLRKPTQVSTAA